MHPSAYRHWELCVDQYLPTTGRHRVVDLGSRVSDHQSVPHRTLFSRHGIDDVGVDVSDGLNVESQVPGGGLRDGSLARARP
ncbi:MAG: hypothetical protein ABIS86_23505 [Streptosporangiaceae bacterium]